MSVYRSRVTMTTNTVLPLSVLLLTAGCVCNSLQPTNLSACPQQSSFPFEPDNCLSLHPSYFKFSLTSHRNQTGHWVAQVRLEHGNQQEPGSDNSKTGQWHVDLQQISAQRAGVHGVKMVATITGPPPRTPPGYQLFPGVGYYKFHKTGKNWDQARRTCEQEDGHLVVINSEAESKVLADLFASEPKINGVMHNNYAFIGFHDRYVEGEYLTIFGKPLDTSGFTRWVGEGQPDNAGGNENCGSIHRNGGLNDIPCPWKLAFFCEYEPW